MNWEHMTADNKTAAHNTAADNGPTPEGVGTDSSSSDSTETVAGRDASTRKPRTKSARAAARLTGEADQTREADHTAEAEGLDDGRDDTTDDGRDDSTADGSSAAQTPTDRAPAAKARRASREVSFTISAGGVLKVLAGIVVVALIVGVGLLGWGYYRDQQRLAAFDDAKAASSVFTVKLVSTMNSDAVGDMKTLLGPLSTGEFRTNLEREQTDGTKALRDLNVKATPTVKSVSVESFDTDRASTAVLVEVSGTSTIAPSGGKELMLVWLDLQKEDGSWKVSKLSGAQAGLGQQQGTNGPAADTQGGSANPAPAAPTPAAPTPAAPTPAPGG